MVAGACLLVSALVAAGCTTGDSGRLGGSGPAIADAAAVPPMGWNSWNSLGCRVDEQDVRVQADALVATGLRDSGYRYVVVDDCWSAPQRGADGTLQADPVRFPSGMAALARYVHDRGLKFGLYSSAQGQTCAQMQGAYPGATGSGGHEKTDAQTFAAWGADLLKYDWCSTAATDRKVQVKAFTAMRDALRRTKKPIVYSINPNSGVAGSVPGATADWGGVATTTRFTNDSAPTWLSTAGPSGPQGIIGIVDAAAPLTRRVRPQAFLDPDVLFTGATTLSPAMQRTQLSMWAMMAAPLMIGTDVTALSPRAVALLKNAGVVGIDQDGRAQAGAPVDNRPEVWSRALGDKGIAVSLTNRGSHPTEMSVPLASLGLVGDKSVQGVDAWSGARYPAEHGELSVTVAAHDTAVLRVE